MADFAAMSHDERVLYLAGLLLPDGKPRFPMLREKCGPFCMDAGHCLTRALFPEINCEGRGWVPVETSDALEAAIDSLGRYWSDSYSPGYEYPWEVEIEPASIDAAVPFAQSNVSRQDARSLALCKAVEGER